MSDVLLRAFARQHSVNQTLALLLCVVVFSSCGGGGLPGGGPFPRGTTVFVSVQNARSKAGINGAVVTLRKPNDTSGKELQASPMNPFPGDYWFMQDVPGGNYTLVVRASGFHEYSANVVVLELKTNNFNVLMKPL